MPTSEMLFSFKVSFLWLCFFLNNHFWLLERI